MSTVVELPRASLVMLSGALLQSMLSLLVLASYDNKNGIFLAYRRWGRLRHYLPIHQPPEGVCLKNDVSMYLHVCMLYLCVSMRASLYVVSLCAFMYLCMLHL